MGEVGCVFPARIKRLKMRNPCQNGHPPSAPQKLHVSFLLRFQRGASPSDWLVELRPHLGGLSEFSRKTDVFLWSSGLFFRGKRGSYTPQRPTASSICIRLGRSRKTGAVHAYHVINNCSTHRRGSDGIPTNAIASSEQLKVPPQPPSAPSPIFFDFKKADPKGRPLLVVGG